MPHIRPLLSTPPAGYRRIRWLAPPALALLGLAALPLDLPIARWFHDGHCPSELLRWLSFCETYAYGFGVACILLTVAVLDVRARPLLPRAIALTIAGGLLANVVKLLVARARPHDFDLTVASQTVWDTFGPWLPGSKATSGHQSFPSAHMATAVGLTAALVWLYPRGRWLFPIFAILAGCQRMSSWSHFLSDVLWGAATGSITVALLLPGGLLSRRFDRWESRWTSGDPTDKSATESIRNAA
jgi:membrane-associated phospholipid phosphatase